MTFWIMDLLICFLLICTCSPENRFIKTAFTADREDQRSIIYQSTVPRSICTPYTLQKD